MKAWEVRSKRRVYDGLPHLAVDVHEVALPDGRVVPDFHQVMVSDFAVLVVVDTDGAFVFLRQYKHGLEDVSLTLPAGHLDDGEAPLDAAKRELMEETGHSAESWQPLRRQRQPTLRHRACLRRGGRCSGARPRLWRSRGNGNNDARPQHRVRRI